MLPYIEQANLQNLIDFRQPLYVGPAWNARLNPIFVQAAGTVVPIFMCPSDGQFQTRTVTDASGANVQLAGTNYMFSYGSGTGTNYDDRYRTDGIVWENSWSRFGDITDGTSNTVLLSESLLGDGVVSTTMPAPPALYRRIASWPGSSSNPAPQPGFNLGGSTIFNPDLSQVVPSQTTSYRGVRGEAWIRGVPFSVVTNGYLTPNHPLPDVNVHGRGWFAPRSNHTGGANLAMCDGSVTFLSNNIDAAAHRARHSRDGGEVFSHE